MPDQKKRRARKVDPWVAWRKRRRAERRDQLAQLPECKSVPVRWVDELRDRYDSDGNVVHVWDAIMQISHQSELRGERLPLPPWVLAYLYQAASEIIGRAVAHPHGASKDRQPDTPPQLAPDERLRVALEALGFHSHGQNNALSKAFKDEADRTIIRKAEERKAEGQAYHKAADDLLPNRESPDRALRYRRKKLSGKK